MSGHTMQGQERAVFNFAPYATDSMGERVITHIDGEEPHFGASFTLSQFENGAVEPYLCLDFSEVVNEPERLYALANHARHELADFLEECARRWRRAEGREPGAMRHAYELFTLPVAHPRLTLSHDQGYCYTPMDVDTPADSWAIVFDSTLGGYAHASICCTSQGQISVNASTSVDGSLEGPEALQLAQTLPLWWADLFKVEAWARKRVEGFIPA